MPAIFCGEIVVLKLNCPNRRAEILMAINRKEVDRIRLGVRIRVIGINPVLYSGKTGPYLAGYSKRFWKLLYESKLVSDALTYKEIWRLPESRRGCEHYPATERRKPCTRTV